MKVLLTAFSSFLLYYIVYILLLLFIFIFIFIFELARYLLSLDLVAWFRDRMANSSDLQRTLCGVIRRRPRSSWATLAAHRLKHFQRIGQ